MRRRLMGSDSGIRATLVQHLDTQGGDVVFYDPDNNAKVYYRLDDGEDVIPKSYVPIGIVVIPANHNVYSDYACGVMSLVGMSHNTPDTGSITPSGLYWGPTQDVESLYNYNRVVNIGTTGISSSAQGLDWFGALPSDIFTGDACETGFYPTEWPYGTVYSPSPYNADGSRNPVYYQTSSPSDTTNALSDFNGKQNTQQLLNLAIGQSNWRTDSTIINSDSTGYYPPACCCWRFHTKGTKQGDWYLPSCGELGYMVPKLGIILNALSKLRNLSIDVFTDDFINNKVWTSTEYADYSVREIALSIGHIFDGYKNDASKIAIAFTQIGALERNYGDIFISGGNVSDIPAGGGSSQVVNYTYSQTYGYGDSTTNGGTITSGADINVTSVSADTLGTTEKERTKIGDSVLTVSMNGKTATASYAVYQAENKIESSVESGGETTWGDVVAPDNFTFTNVISAAGGSDYVDLGPATQSYVTSQKDVTLTYTSGIDKVMMIAAQESGTVNIPISSIDLAAYFSYSGNRVAVTFPSRGTVLGYEAIHVCTVTYSGNGSKSDTCNVTAKQERNYIESLDYEIFASTINQPVAASGGSNMSTGYELNDVIATSGASVGALNVRINIQSWSYNSSSFTHTNCSYSDYNINSSTGVITWNSRSTITGDLRSVSGVFTCTVKISITGTSYCSTGVTGTFIRGVSFATHQAKNGISTINTYCEQIYHGTFDRVYLYATRLGDITNLSLLTAEVYTTFDSGARLNERGIKFRTFEDRYNPYIDFNGTRGVCRLTYYSSYTNGNLIGTFSYQGTSYTVGIDSYIIGSSYFHGVNVTLTNRNDYSYGLIIYSITISAGDDSYINTNIYQTGQVLSGSTSNHLFVGIWSNDYTFVKFVKYITNTSYSYVIYDAVNLSFTTSDRMSLYFDTTAHYGSANLTKHSTYSTQDRIEIEIY